MRLLFDAEKSLHTMTYNTVQEWEYIGSSGAPTGHPMNTNVQYQNFCGTGVSHTDICSLNMEYGDFVDSVRISNSKNDPCYTLFKTVNYSGKVVLHCHDFFHKVIYMMGWVNTFVT